MKVMIKMEYKQSQVNHKIFINYSYLGRDIILLIYVDNIIVIINDDKEK